jgi:hypothetical protein
MSPEQGKLHISGARRKEEEFVAEDWYLDRIDDVDRLAGELHDVLDQTIEAFMTARKARLAGAPLNEIVADAAARGGTNIRRTAAEACRAFTAAITEYRAATIRMLVDEEGMTFSDIGRITGVSRQMVGRLYRAAGGGVDCES